MAPDYEDARSVVFALGGCQLVLELAEQAGTPSTVVYRGGDRLPA